MNGGYIDGFVFTVPKKKVAAYTKMAKWGAAAWIKNGALAYYECKGDDLKVKPGPDGSKARSFIETARATPNDTVWFSFIVYRNKKHRNAVNKKVHAQMEKEAKKWEGVPMPFDPSQMAYGGFTAIVRR